MINDLECRNHSGLSYEGAFFVSGSRILHFVSCDLKWSSNECMSERAESSMSDENLGTRIEKALERISAETVSIGSFQDLGKAMAVLFQEFLRLSVFEEFGVLLWIEEEKGWLKAFPAHRKGADRAPADAPWFSEDIVIEPRTFVHLQKGLPQMTSFIGEDWREYWRDGKPWVAQDDEGSRWMWVPFKHGFVRLKNLQVPDEQGAIVVILL